MSPRDLVLGKLPSARALTTGGWVAKCPAHRDGRPSLSVSLGDDGRVLLKCHTGCETATIVAAMGLTMRDLMPADGPTFSPSRAGHVTSARNPVAERAPLRVVGKTASAVPAPAATEETPEADPRTWPVTQRYPYVDCDGRLLFEVLRKQEPGGTRKTFTQVKADGSYGLKGIEERPLFRAPAVQQAIAGGQPVLVVEGEKDVLTAEQLGWVATTNCGGAAGWKPEYVTALTNADVVLLPDNDEAGRAWLEKVAHSLVGYAKRIRVVPLPGVAEKGDLTDWVEAGGTSEKLAALILKAKAWRAGDPLPSAPVPSKFMVLRADALRDLPPVTWMVDDMLPTDALAAFVGASGKGKTFVTIGLGCAVATGQPWLGRVIGAPGAVLYIAAEGTAGLRARVGAVVDAYGLPNDLPLYFICETVNLMERSDAEEVIRAMVALPEVPRLVVVDTLHRSMIGGDENSAKDIGMVIANADAIRRAAGCTVLIVHHNKKDADIERGSTALRAACDTMLMLRDEEPLRVLACEKQKDAREFADVPLLFKEFGGSLVVERADGLSDAVDVAADPLNLSDQERRLLTSLAAASDVDGLSSTEWTQVAGMTHATYHRTRARLTRAGLVEKQRGYQGKFSITQAGRSALRNAAQRSHVGGDTSVRVIDTFSKDGGYIAPPKGGAINNRPRRDGITGESLRETNRPVSRRSGRDRAAGPDGPPAWVTEWREFGPDEVAS